jgi:hypothetical protein
MADMRTQTDVRPLSHSATRSRKMSRQYALHAPPILDSAERVAGHRATSVVISARGIYDLSSHNSRSRWWLGDGQGVGKPPRPVQIRRGASNLYQPFFLTVADAGSLSASCDLGTVGHNWRSSCSIAARCNASTTRV